eukprot:TRINITY_DN674_c2_g1_i1.p2 TRINITY_DN674_c2_g1~~TRINITY_DN674_c2_g1_i1.p2  ORF type:complete len:353 (+),score=131.76 TRINITY_DN674_c2_g1_i1:144-1202(+)
MGQQHIRTVALVSLVVQNASLALLIRYAAVEGPMYAATTAVVCAEVIKVALSLLLQTQEDKGVAGLLHTLKRDILQQPVEVLKMGVPAALFCLQNNLAYVAIANLDGPTYQLLSQLKLLTTAMFSVTMLNRTLAAHQWLSLCLLACGVGLVQLSTAGGEAKRDENSVTGLVCVLLACVSSGFAGVYFEKVLKTSTVSIWVRNIQLGVYGTVIGLAGVYFGPDAAAVAQHGFLNGYTGVVWAGVLSNSLGGLIVAVVVKYADNVIKGFATSIAILVTCIISYFLFSFTVTAQFLLGGALVLYSTHLYSQVHHPVKAAGAAAPESSLKDAELSELLSARGAAAEGAEELGQSRP